jgi:hypothetical protein
MIVDGFFQPNLVPAAKYRSVLDAINNQGPTGIWLRVLNLAECYDQHTNCFNISAIEEKQFLKPSDNR